MKVKSNRRLAAWALGPKRSSFSGRGVPTQAVGVRFWHKAEMAVAVSNVRFWGQSGHCEFRASCLLLTQSGHSPPDIPVQHPLSQFLAVC